ncbi:MAG: LamG-like jellyroll fold domain-containing protein [Patescibacteria group bacterium]
MKSVLLTLSLIFILVFSVNTYAQAVPAPQWILKFDGSYDDVSGNNKITTAYGTSTAIVNDGVRGQVLSLDGTTGNYVSVAHQLTADYTKAAWVLKSTTVAASIISGGVSGGNADLFWVTTNRSGVPNVNSLKAGQIASSTTYHYTYNPVAFPLDVWTHVALTYESSTKTYRMYQNGSLVSASSSDIAAVSTAIQQIGARQSANIWSGKIDDAEMWNVALSDAQILSLYQGDLGIATSTPVAPVIYSVPYAVNGRVGLKWNATSTFASNIDYVIEYKKSSDSSWSVFNDGVSLLKSTEITGLTDDIPYDIRVRSVSSQGTSTPSAFVTTTSHTARVPPPQWLLKFEGNYNDSSNNGRNGVASGTPNIVTDSTRGQVLSLTGGTSGYVSVANPINGSYSKSAWVYKNPTSQDGSIISTELLNPYGDLLYISNNTTVTGEPTTMALKGGTYTPAAHYVYNPIAFPTETWVHTIITYDASTKIYNLYQDGKLVSTATSSQPVDTTSTIQQVGALKGTYVLNGKIDNASVWYSALTTDEIALLYLGDTGEGVNIPNRPGNVRTRSSQGAVTVSWDAPLDNGSVITDYIIEFKRVIDNVWTVAPDGVRATTTATISGLTDAVPYHFRVSAVNSLGTSTASYTIRALPGVYTYMHILSGGQSLSIGSRSTAISTTQPYNNMTLSNGPTGTTTPLIPLVETIVETPSSGMANAFSAYSQTDNPVVIGLHGFGGYSYYELKKGTAQYAKGIEQAVTTKAFVESIGSTYHPVGVTIVHGEADYIDMNFSTYQGYLEEWQRDYENDINALTGATSTLPMFTNQMNTAWTGEIAVAQLQTHKSNPGKIILVQPKYQYVYFTDRLHLLNIESKHMGEMFAKVMHKVIHEGKTWNPLMPTDVTRSGKEVRIKYAIPEGNLAIDTSTVAQRPNYGFEFYQAGGTVPITISSVELVNNNTEVKLTLSDIPDGTDHRIRYAWTCYGGGTGPGKCGNSGDGTYVGGNIRDTDTSVSPSIDGTNLPLYDWSVTFDEPIFSNDAPVQRGTVSTPVSRPTVSYGTSQNAVQEKPMPVITSKPTVTTSEIFTRDLTINTIGADVKNLQVFLNAQGFIISSSGPGSKGKETTQFGIKTRTALAKFQKASGIVPASGYFGPITRKFILIKK